MVGTERGKAVRSRSVLTVLTVGAAAVATVAGVRLPATGVGAVDALGAFALLVMVAGTVPAPATPEGGLSPTPVAAVPPGPAVAEVAAATVIALGSVGAGLAGHLAAHPLAVPFAAAGAVLPLVATAMPVRPAARSVIWVLGAVSFGVAALMATRGLAPSAAWAALVAMAGLPAADGLTAGLSRLRHPGSGGVSLAGRLAAAGGPGRAAVVVAGGAVVECGLGALGALAAGGHGAPLAIAVASSAVIALVVVVGLTAPAGRRATAGGRVPRWLAWGGGAVIVVAVAGLVPPGVAAASARGTALAGEAAAQRGLASGRSGHLHAAAADFAAARRDFAAARGDLAGPWVSLGEAYPVVAPNLRAVRVLAAEGTALAGQGTELSLAGDRFRYGIHGGTVPVASLAATAPRFGAAARVIAGADRSLSELDRSLLVGPVARAVSRLDTQLATARRDVTTADGIATFVPGLLGLDGTRRYFVAFETDAEQRATGGLIGLNGVLTVTGGHLTLSGLESSTALNLGTNVRVLHAPPDYVARYGAFDPAYNWQMVNLSPDFPTVGKVIADLYPQSGGTPVDGVIAVDPAGLAAIMKLTGPVTLPGWPVPITAANVVAVTQNQAYIAYAGHEAARQAFLIQFVHAVFHQVSNLDLHDPVTLVDDLAPAVDGGHLLVYAGRPAEEAYLASLHMTGAVPPVTSDAFEVTTQNAAANKIDYYLTRSVDYRVHLTPLAGTGPSAGATTAAASGTVSVSLHNGAPLGLPPIVDGPGFPGLVAGEDRIFVTLYTPLQFSHPTLNGEPSGLEPQRELGRWADATFVNIAAGHTATLTAHLSGTVHLAAGGWYELDLPLQPLINPDQVTVTVTLAPGWRVAAARGARITSATAAGVQLSMSTPHVVRVRLAPAG